MAALIRSRRSERHIPQILAAEISNSEESVPKEATVTENVSLHGARVITVWPWQTGTRLLVTFLWVAFALKEGLLTASARRAAASPLGWSYPDSCKPHSEPNLVLGGRTCAPISTSWRGKVSLRGGTIRESGRPAESGSTGIAKEVKILRESET